MPVVGPQAKCMCFFRLTVVAPPKSLGIFGSEGSCVVAKEAQECRPMPVLTPHDERRVAVAAGCDPRRVRAYLRGDPTRSTTAARIADALRSLGFQAAPPLADDPTKPKIQ